MAIQQKKSQYAREELVTVSQGMKYRLPKQLTTSDSTYVLPPKQTLHKRRRIPVLAIIIGVLIIAIVVVVVLHLTGKISSVVSAVPHL